MAIKVPNVAMFKDIFKCKIRDCCESQLVIILCVNYVRLGLNELNKGHISNAKNWVQLGKMNIR